MASKPTHQTLVTQAAHLMDDRAYAYLGDESGGPITPEADIIGVFNHIILDSKFGSMDNKTILSWFPSDVLIEVVRWLDEIISAAEAEEAEEEEI